MAKRTPVKSKSARIRVLVVDGHSVVREGLALYVNDKPDLEVVAVAGDAAGGLKAVETSKPDVVIVDLSLGDMNGLDFIKDLKAKYPGLPTLVLSMHDETRYARQALRAGARGYVMKREDVEKVVDGIRRVFAGYVYVSKKVLSMMLRKFVGDADDVTGSPVDSLTGRELKILRMLGRGFVTRTIAKKLFISVVTVRTHRAHIKEKLGLGNGEELLQYAVRWIQDQDEA